VGHSKGGHSLQSFNRRAIEKEPHIPRPSFAKSVSSTPIFLHNAMHILSKALKILFLSVAMADNIEKIDEWLKEQGLNTFGDQVGMMYMGGNPLFNEATGEAQDRMEYLVGKFPTKPWDQATPQL